MSDTSSTPRERLAHRRGDYGFDAPFVPIVFVIIGVVLLGLAVASLWTFKQPILALVCLIYAMYMLLSAASYIYTTRMGKFRIWGRITHRFAPPWR